MLGLARQKSTRSLQMSSLPSRAVDFSTAAQVDLLLRSDAKESGITTLTLNNPSKYNVLSWDMLCALEEQLDDISGDQVSCGQCYDRSMHEPSMVTYTRSP